MIYIGDNLPTHDHPEENREGTIVKPRWKAVKKGMFWRVEMKITEQASALLIGQEKEWKKGEYRVPVRVDKVQAQAVADWLNDL